MRPRPTLAHVAHDPDRTPATGDGGQRWSRLDRPPLSQAALRRALVLPEGPLARLDVVQQVASTNAELSARAGQGGWPDLSVLTAEHQTAGRGRLGRSWQTPERAALATSVLLRPGPGVPEEAWGWLPLAAGLAVVQALRDVAGLGVALKWPNDVVLGSGRPDAGAADELKLCGVLAEVTSTPEGRAVVLGFGLNVSQAVEELPVPTATSVLVAGGATTDRDTLLRACLRALADGYRRWSTADGDAVRCGLADSVREVCSTLGRQVRVELPGAAEPLVGTAEGIDDAGRLLVRDAAGRPHAVAAGDVVHLRPAPDADHRAPESRP